MKAKWLVLLALAFILVALGAERFTAFRVSRALAQQDKLKREFDIADQRERGRDTESRQYKEIEQLAAKIVAPQKNWQTDPAQLYRWFTETGARTNVRVLSIKIVPMGSNESNLVAAGTYNRIRFDLDLEGEYSPLIRYIDAVERSGQPMIVDTFSLLADRTTGSGGKAKLFVSCLSPVPETETSK